MKHNQETLLSTSLFHFLAHLVITVHQEVYLQQLVLLELIIQLNLDLVMSLASNALSTISTILK